MCFSPADSRFEYSRSLHGRPTYSRSTVVQSYGRSLHGRPTQVVVGRACAGASRLCSQLRRTSGAKAVISHSMVSQDIISHSTWYPTRHNMRFGTRSCALGSFAQSVRSVRLGCESPARASALTTVPTPCLPDCGVLDVGCAPTKRIGGSHHSGVWARALVRVRVQMRVSTASACMRTRTGRAEKRFTYGRLQWLLPSHSTGPAALLPLFLVRPCSPSPHVRWLWGRPLTASNRAF